MKVYTSKEGLKFSISPTNRPAEGEVVYFTTAEWDWMKFHCKDPERFRLIYNLKKDDYLYSPIPEKEITVAAKLALEIGGQIIEQLKRGKKSEL
jgi:hypothetical protein